jgi:hypothetical protein
LVRPDTVSELCLPIFVGGRLVGALNLESRFRDGYVDAVETAAAVAEQIGLSLQYARRAHEQTVLSMSTASTASVHELSKSVDRLRDLANGPDVPARLASEMVSTASTIAACIQSGTELVDEPPVALSELVDQVLRELKLSKTFVQRGEPLQDVRLSSGDALALRVALAALFDNANNNVHNLDPTMNLSWRRHSVGGCDYNRLLIANSIALPVPREVLRVLFRKPLRPRGSDRVHIGAFTAAALVRSMGGEVFIRRSEPPRFVVGVDIPIKRGDMAVQQERVA